MARLYSNLIDGSSRRYFFGLDSAPGGILPQTLQLRVTGLTPTVFTQVQVFRTPAPAVITLNGLAIRSDYLPSPVPAAISALGRAPTLVTQLIVTNDMSPDYSEPASFPPTILFINTVTPAPAMITLGGLQPNASPGGDIGYVSPGVGLVTIGGLTANLIFTEADIGRIDVIGLQPTIATLLEVSPEVGQITINGQQVELQKPFQWIDVDAPPPLIWSTTTVSNA
jgi:hypothetical protein